MEGSPFPPFFLSSFCEAAKKWKKRRWDEWWMVGGHLITCSGFPKRKTCIKHENIRTVNLELLLKGFEVNFFFENFFLNSNGPFISFLPRLEVGRGGRGKRGPFHCSSIQALSFGTNTQWRKGG